MLNYQGFNGMCAGDAPLYPTYGATQATFNGTTNGTKTLTVNSGTPPALFSYLNGAGSHQQQKCFRAVLLRSHCLMRSLL